MVSIAGRFGVLTVLITGSSLGSVFINPALGEEACLSAPTHAAPEGERWYYRTDPVKQIKCWHLGAKAQPASIAQQTQPSPIRILPDDRAPNHSPLGAVNPKPGPANGRQIAQPAQSLPQRSEEKRNRQVLHGSASVPLPKPAPHRAGAKVQHTGTAEVGPSQALRSTQASESTKIQDPNNGATSTAGAESRPAAAPMYLPRPLGVEANPVQAGVPNDSGDTAGIPSPPMLPIARSPAGEVEPRSSLSRALERLQPSMSPPAETLESVQPSKSAPAETVESLRPSQSVPAKTLEDDKPAIQHAEKPRQEQAPSQTVTPDVQGPEPGPIADAAKSTKENLPVELIHKIKTAEGALKNYFSLAVAVVLCMLLFGLILACAFVNGITKRILRLAVASVSPSNRF